MRFRAAVLRTPGGSLTLETVETLPLAPGEVLVRVGATGLCHTDLEAASGQLASPLPVVLGHEAAGTVAAVGQGVEKPRLGDHVILSWNPHCGSCVPCGQGMPILCDTYLDRGPRGLMFDGTTRLRLDGQPLHTFMFVSSFAEYCVVPASCAVAVPKEIPFDRACLIGCGIMTGFGGATRVARVAVGARVAVLGCGAVGLGAVQGARLAGAEVVVAVDLDPKKLALARQLGATHAVDARDKDALGQVRALASRGMDVVLEAAGSPRAFRDSAEMVRPGGQVVWLGKVGVQQEVTFRWGALMQEKRFVRSSYGGARPQVDFPYLARAYLDGRLQLDPLLSRHIRLEDLNQGLDALRRGEVVRAVVTFDG
jgi:S-(hydroxymethyl)glutathione dehydrogenase / alcohol dehydrogenase